MVALSALIFVVQDRRSLLRGLAVFSLCAASLPVAWLAWGARAGGDPLFFAHYIMTDHAGLAADVVGRFGPLLGRARQLGIWTLAFVAAMTLPGALAAAIALGRGWRPSSPRALDANMRIVAVTALAPPALYLARGLLLQSFEPLARFALVPGALLLPLAAAAVPLARGRQFRIATAAAAVVFSLAVWLVATVGRDRIWAGAESMGALTRLDGEDRALARWLRAHRRAHEPVMIEPLAFAEIGIAHAAGVPWTESITLIVTREPRATVAESMRATGARFVVGYDRDEGLAEPPARLALARSAARRSDRPLADHGARALIERSISSRAPWIAHVVGSALRLISSTKFTPTLLGDRVLCDTVAADRGAARFFTWRTPGDSPVWYRRRSRSSS